MLLKQYEKYVIKKQDIAINQKLIWLYPTFTLALTSNETFSQCTLIHSWLFIFINVVKATTITLLLKHSPSRLYLPCSFQTILISKVILLYAWLLVNQDIYFPVINIVIVMIIDTYKIISCYEDYRAQLNSILFVKKFITSCLQKWFLWLS